MKLRIALGADHTGFELKDVLLTMLQNAGYTVKDFGAYSLEAFDYPDAAHPVARSIQSGVYDRGILFCGTANGMAITANKHTGIRAGLAWNEEIAKLVRQHNDANILCIPSRYTDIDTMLRMVEAFLLTDFEGGRHARRVDKIAVV
jgi:ribose 5-phosphate isomerase B